MSIRFRVTLILFCFAFFLVVARLFYWQVVKADELTALGHSQYGQNVKVTGQRGEIQTADGFPIATNRLSYLVYVNPKEVKEKQELAEKIAPILQEDAASISSLLDLDRFWVPLKRSVDDSTKETIEKMKIPGVGFEEEYTRFYPEGSMAAQLLGFVGKDEFGRDKGYFGLEGYYDRQLQGKTFTAVKVSDAFGRPIVSQNSLDDKEKRGRTLVLNIDRSIQYAVEKHLKDGIEKYGASSGMVGVIDPKTGNLLAMASLPSFDPRAYQEFSDSLYKNPLITNLYEPGSTFKALVMAAGMDAKLVKPDTKCPICSKPVSIGGYEIRTWNNQYIENITMTEVIQHSDNTGMVYVAQSLGLDRMFSYFHKFGIGDLTNIDLQGEVYPSLRDKDQWHPIDLATAGFGQGISVTPIELLSAFASIADGGVRMEPHVVSRIITADGETIGILPKVVDATISEPTAKVMTEILVNAVNKGEAQWTRLKGYRVAGKTGTAQIPIAGHYDANKTIASFIGFAPADDPKFAMLVVVDRPTTSIYGAETAAPIFFQIAKDILTYYGVPPTEPTETP